MRRLDFWVYLSCLGGVVMSIKPWICNGSRTIVKDRWIDLHADDCALPDGTKISPFYVNDVPDFVVVVAVTVDGDFVFVRQYRHGTRQILLELPAGCMEPTDANPAAGAARELFEETGYAGSEPVFLCKVAPNAACISNFAHCYLITDCKRVSGQHLDATEDLEIVVMSAEETKKLMAEGRLVQAVHVAAMYYAEKILNK